MRALLDINVLIAVLDPEHSHNEVAHRWLNVNLAQGWASCPLTENGVIRIMSSKGYSATARASADDIAVRLREFIAASNHEFWPDDISLLDSTRFNLRAAFTPLHLTDAYLLALAVEKGGRLVIFDRSIPAEAVPGVTSESLLVLPSDPVAAA